MNAFMSLITVMLDLLKDLKKGKKKKQEKLPWFKMLIDINC